MEFVKRLTAERVNAVYLYVLEGETDVIKGILAFFLIIVLLCSCTSQPLTIESNIESLPSSTPSVSLPATSPLLEIAHDVVILPVSPATESIETYNDLGETVFYLNDTEVTEAEFNDFVSNSDYWKTDLASWYEFNEENIDKYLIWNVPPQEIKDEQPKTENISQNNDNVPQQGENNDFELTVSACYTKALQEFMNNAVGKTYSILFDLDGDGTEEMIALDEGIAEPETEHWGAYAIGMRIAVFNVKDGECTAEYIESLAITHSTYMVYISSRNDIVIYDTFEGTMYRVYSYKNGLLTKEAELVDGCYANSIYYSIDGIECGEAQYDDKLKELNVNDNNVALGIGDLLYFWHKNEEIPLRDDTLKILASENDS